MWGPRKRGWAVSLGAGVFALVSVVLWGAVLRASEGGERERPAGRPSDLSEATEECIDCHSEVTPGIVVDWGRSRHAAVTVEEALARDPVERRISAEEIPQDLFAVSVGCAECHTRNSGKHADAFDHFGTEVHVIVTPSDCAQCHPEEVAQYSENLMSHARTNLAENALYGMLMETINGVQVFDGARLAHHPPDDRTGAESCFYCHGTRVGVTGLSARETDLGEVEFPVLSGWPNQGVGRANPDGSDGCCAACHTRHRFSIEVARKPETCSECHTGPDVPAFKVYSVSKHGNLYASLQSRWDFREVPWVPGRDFSAPTCAGCHVSLLATEEGEVIVPRTHRMNDRLPWRIFGLPYAHPHPISANTTGIVNGAGLPLPTELTGEVVEGFLIDPPEIEARRARMQRSCRQCHDSGWVDGQFERFEHAISEANRMTLPATQVLLKSWEGGLAEGPGAGGNPFDEPIEKMWVEQWLFYANSTRFASAMGGADYGVFADGRWALSKNLREMAAWWRERSE